MKLLLALLALFVVSPCCAQELLGPRDLAVVNNELVRVKPQPTKVEPFNSLWAYDAFAPHRRLTGKGVTVAVLDSGISSHPEFNGKNIQGKDFSGSGTLNDLRGHGTALIGVIAAKGIKFKGVAPQASVIAYKVDYGVLQTAPQALAAAMNAVLEYNRNNPNQKIAVVNLSYGVNGGGYAPLSEAIRQAYESGVVVVAPTGNTDFPGVDYPANMPEVIAVGALAYDGGIYGKSSYGPQLDFLAPGDRVYSTSNDQDYNYTSGTSISSAYVAGLAALAVEGLYKKMGTWPTVPEVRDALKAAAVKLPGVPDLRQGYGVIDVKRLERQF